jgi:hypothetical protein
MTARRVPRSSLAVLAVSLSLVAAGLVAGPGVVVANHGASDADYTVEPMDDRSPGATDVKYGQIVVGDAGVDLQTLESMEAVYEEGSWANCNPGDSDVFGIDRGNTHDGYGIDEELQDNTQSISAGEDVFRVEFYGENDFGPSTHLNDGDAVVSVAKCIDNPDEPGWYQITGSTTGVTEDGERVTVSGASHYFWICDCEGEAEAREQLGPPPSEDQDTETPSTPSGDGGSGDAEDGSGAGTGEDAGGATATGDGGSGGDATTEDAATGGSDDGPGSSTPTETGGAMGDAGSSGSSQAAGGDGGGAGSWDRYRIQTPTPGAGDGFGGGVALVAFLGAALLFYRRR